jgi:hypothetical protein
MKRLTWLTAALLAPALAFADPKTPDEWYAEGKNQYDLGNFDKAIDAFKRGFELEPADNKKSAYLFNIAQAYRQQGKCKDAQFFYKRYLAFKDADTAKPLDASARKEIEDRIKELDDCSKQQDALKNKPPDSNPDGTKPDGAKPDGTKPDGTRVGDVTPPPPGGGDVPPPTAKPFADPTVVSVHVEGGAAKLTAGSLDVPTQASFALLGGYPLAINEKIGLEVGGAFTFTPVPFDDAMGAGKNATMFGAMANAGLRYKVAPKIGVRGDLGLGALVFSGLSKSPFTDFAETSGALTMFHFRLGLSGDYLITPNIVASLTAAGAWSPGKEGMQVMGEDISSITTTYFMLGIGYRK